MKYIDLHVHSNASDGTLSPTELVKAAMKNNLSAFALTDHDTIKGIDEAISAASDLSKNGQSIRVIPGTELSVTYMGQDIHILGLFIDYKDPEFCKLLDDAALERENRNHKMIDNLASAGIDITMEKLRASEGDAILTRAHFAKYLKEQGVVTSMQEAFQKYLSKGTPYYVVRNYICAESAISRIKMAGGIPVLAHPLLYKLSNTELDRLISYLKECGLVGIEAIYHANTGFDESYIKKFANKYELLVTGGSDFHGANKPQLDIGIGRGNLKIPYSILEKLERYLLETI